MSPIDETSNWEVPESSFAIQDGGESRALRLMLSREEGEEIGLFLAGEFGRSITRTACRSLERTVSVQVTQYAIAQCHLSIWRKEETGALALGKRPPCPAGAEFVEEDKH